MLGWLFGRGRKTARKAAPPPELQAMFRRILARYDAAQTSDANSRHWGMADAMSANAAHSPGVRKLLRERARYEVANNSWACGIVRTLVSHVIGTGPRLQVRTGDREIDHAIETAFRQWACQANLTETLQVLHRGKVVDGEGFLILGRNHRYDVPLSVRAMEADQVESPYLGTWDLDVVDGIRHDAQWNPTEYFVLKYHPGDRMNMAPLDGDWYPVDQVIHWYRTERASQLRGVPDITPALELFALLRRFTLATVTAAEVAALFAAYIKTTSPVDEPAASPGDFESFAIERGSITTLPEGWDIAQVKPDHPATTYEMFVRMLLNEIARCLSMPYNIATCNSAGYNYSSGRLDHQTYYSQIYIEQAALERKVLDRILAAWFDEAATTPGILPHGTPPIAQIQHEWFWDAPGAIDPQTEETAAEMRLSNGLSSHQSEYATRGQDWEIEQQRAAEALGITLEDYRARLAAKLLGPPVAAAPAAGDPAAASGGEFGQTGRRQWQNNVKAIRDVLDDLIEGRHTEVMARELLRALGLSPERAQALIDDARDGSVDDEELSLQAAAKLVTFSAPVKFTAAAGESQSRRVEIVAYNGGPLSVSGFDMPVIVDYEGLSIPESYPLLSGHDWDDPAAVLGQVDETTLEIPQLIAHGEILSDGPRAREILNLAAKGYAWQVSIGASIEQTQRVAAGQEIEVNGQVWAGPVYVARRASLREVSFVGVGADAQTSAAIAASAAPGGIMEFEAWVTSLGLDPTTLSDEQRAELRKAYDALQAPPAEPPPSGDATADGETDNGETDDDDEEQPGDTPPAATASAVNQLRRQTAREVERINRVRRICASANNPTLEARAIRDGWSAERTELEVLRASANRGPAVHVRNTDNSPRILEASLCRAAGYQGLEQAFTTRELEVSERQYRRGIGLQELLLTAAWQAGCSERFLNTATIRPVLQAAFSTGSIPGILSNTANKFLLQGYLSVEDTWKRIASIASVQDFKTRTSYRLTTGGTFDQVGPDGEIKHGTYGEQSYSNRAATYARMLSITREQIINDDLGALSDLPKQLGRMGALKFNQVFWAKFLDHAAFFVAGNRNYIEGADTVLSHEGLRQAVYVFRKQIDDGGNPLGIDPKILLVPPELEEPADALYTSLNVNTGGSSSKSKVENRNVFAGKYEPVVSSYLSSESFSGSSATAWYLLGDPNDVPVIEAAFLNGVQTPTVETAEADFNVLGVQMRGYFDFGVELQDHRGGVKSKGAA